VTVNNYRTIVQDYVRDNRMLFFRCCDHVLRKKPIETSPTTPQMRRRRPNLVNGVFTGPEHGPLAVNTARVNTCDTLTLVTIRPVNTGVKK